MNIESLPSLWRVRSEKRHSAVTRDMSSVNARLTQIEGTLSTLSQKLDYIIGMINPIPSSDSAKDEMKSPVHNTRVRIGRMEMLQIRASMQNVTGQMEHGETQAPQSLSDQDTQEGSDPEANVESDKEPTEESNCDKQKLHDEEQKNTLKTKSTLRDQKNTVEEQGNEAEDQKNTVEKQKRAAEITWSCHHCGLWLQGESSKCKYCKEKTKPVNIKHSMFEEVSLKGNSDLLCFSKPDLMQHIHKEYFLGGSDICENNTFNGTTISQGDYKCQDVGYEMNKVAAGD